MSAHIYEPAELHRYKPHIDYLALFEAKRRDLDNSICPPLFLAPMEILADSSFRLAISSNIGGFDESCKEFIRVPDNYPQGANTEMYPASLTKKYDCMELAPTPLAAQIMGGSPALLGQVAAQLVRQGAPRIDLNCGCPANAVTGKGAGSSLLRDPEKVYNCTAAMVRSVGDTWAAGGRNSAEGTRPIVSVKMRSGFHDTSLFHENLAAVQEAGAEMLTLHPRTKDQGYKGSAAWSLIAEAASVLDIPVIGNGDVTTPAMAMELAQYTGCQGIMVGRGAVQDPFIFHRIRAAWANDGELPFSCAEEVDMLEGFLRRLVQEVGMASRRRSRGPEEGRAQKAKMGRVKQVCNYLFQSSTDMSTALYPILRANPKEQTAEALLDDVLKLLEELWGAEGPPQHALVNHFSHNSSQENTRQQTANDSSSPGHN